MCMYYLGFSIQHTSWVSGGQRATVVFPSESCLDLKKEQTSSPPEMHVLKITVIN